MPTVIDVPGIPVHAHVSGSFDSNDEVTPWYRSGTSTQYVIGPDDIINLMKVIVAIQTTAYYDWHMYFSDQTAVGPDAWEIIFEGTGPQDLRGPFIMDFWPNCPSSFPGDALYINKGGSATLDVNVYGFITKTRV